ncbi:MAG: hypothetical protein CVV47_10605 [Spirochaetae bacterium HGW-Spirochaetae-3]|jgi:hypothetical protein|nr:MAG: hypothetical protein CVV47_10605 [Spirochaetae bacterium HGW-Spirochaetae-3]
MRPNVALRVLSTASLRALAAIAVTAAMAAWPAFSQETAEGATAPATPATTAIPARRSVMRDAITVAVVGSVDEAATFADALSVALVRELASAGFRAPEPYAGPATEGGAAGDANLAAAVHGDSGARWVAIVACSIERKRAIWRISVFDFIDGAMVAADTQGAFAGLSAFTLIDESAAGVAKEAGALRNRVAPGPPIEYRLRFLSDDDGATVAFGTGNDARPAGVVADGGLVAPFVAFRAGDPVVVSMARDGYWPRTAVFRPAEADAPIPLPALMPRTRHALSAGLTTSRLFGVSADYRYHLMPDSVFLRAGDSLWLQSAFTTGSVPVLHDELRIGAGAYLFLPPHSKFRFAAGAGLSGIATILFPSDLERKFYFDLSLDAACLSFEWHEPTWAAFLEQRLSYSFGLGSGLLRRGWWETATGPMTFAAGVMLKWP